MNQISIIFPNQLFKNSPLFSLHTEILLLEDSLFFGNDKYVKQKIHANKYIFHRASIMAYQIYLEELDFKVTYGKNENLSSTEDYLYKYSVNNYQSINVIDPHDYLIMKRLKKFSENNNIQINILSSPMFITRDELVDSFNQNTKKPLMRRFYENQRQNTKLLLNKDGTPVGGKYSFDELNRKKVPKKIKIPSLPKFMENKFVSQARHLFNKEKFQCIGSHEFFFYPTTFEEAENWLDEFLENRFSLFGDYEDAISKKEKILWHSLISPILNSGLLTPKEVINKVIRFSEKNKIPINSLEGFIRQIIGWREFIYLVYGKYGTRMRTNNFWGFEKKPMPEVFYKGSTGIEPVDIVIKNILNLGYCHHIERLMVIGNFMLLCRIHPDEVYRWFMEMFIDSYDWVMVPNVYGMSQFSDGGIFSTKPYISSSNYIRKMSNYENGEWCEIWDGLFWKFIKDYESYFRKQYRLSMLTRNLDKMNDSKLDNHIQIANHFLKKLR
mgnify:CR=1 FL=1